MSATLPSRRRQAGAALLAVMFALLITITALAYRSVNIAHAGQQAADLTARLHLAREALIARAVTDANRPGSLPCPDLLTDDNGLGNHPGDGKADNLVRNDCPAYLGWLPWVTLDLPELTDDSGSRLWYALARPLRDDDLAQPINSSTPATLSLDGRGDIAALIIAPGAALGGQQRPSHRPADYLEAGPSAGDTFFRSGPVGTDFNDVVLAVTQQDLMGAVEKRIAGEVLACLEQHALASGNHTHDYPWPAPLSGNGLRGRAGSLFGQLPATQPGPGPQSQLTASRVELQNTGQRLRATSGLPEQLAILDELNDQLNYAKAFHDRVYVSAKTLSLTAKDNTLVLTGLNGALEAAQANGRISVTERRTVQGNGEQAATQLAQLQQALADTGIDPFPDELSARLRNLRDLLASPATVPPTFQQLQDAASALLVLFGNSHTGNTDINHALSEALALGANAAVAAQAAAANPADTGLSTRAVTAARALDDGASRLLAAVAANRVTVHPDEIDARSSQLQGALSQFTALPDSAARNDLAQALRDSRGTIASIDTASSTLAPLRAGSLNALEAAIQSAAMPDDWPRTTSTAQQAIAELNAVGLAMRAHGDNLARESIATAGQRFTERLATFKTIVTRTQADMIPYADALRLATVDLRFWAEIIERQAGTSAILARKSPAASKSQSNPASAYSLADSALNSLNANNGTLKKLQDSIAAPGNTTKAAAAGAALADTLARLEALQHAAENLGGALHSAQADAFPTLWHSRRCAFLQPDSDSTSWWQANQWAATTFFQISARTRTGDGRLTVNGAGTYRSIVLSAGKPLSPQERSHRRTADFLEGRNADISRDGDATAPLRHFVAHPPSAQFNDRLAY